MILYTGRIYRPPGHRSILRFLVPLGDEGPNIGHSLHQKSGGICDWRYNPILELSDI